MGLFDFLTKTRASGYIQQCSSTTTMPVSRATTRLGSRNVRPKIQERRNELRHKTYLSTIVKHDQTEIFATIINFSKGGFGILAGKPFKENEIFNITLSMHNEAPLSIQLGVQSCQKIDDEYFIGTKISEYCPLHAEFFKSMTRAIKLDASKQSA
ncbi:MAG: hypothetical protein ISEC1_P0961 [Thiomicrorhabdus sp.]|nr:MAG: hypothetical protein ISEC1_P0961 [Thiomicrorhabdus sp.]